ncbi:aminotransferase class I/II-fold pyridoxal phosphate-dependent enzyme, partial [Mycobacterium tuberculosis]|nr:aminotransferase class I/II-fold pyridoxal phosphate-dependent enzyme [Mycobacterium tuberculosis]
ERKKIHQWDYRADDIEQKTKLLGNLLQQPEATRSIVFVRKRERVHELANWLREAGINTCWLEGEMGQAKRNEAIKRLTDGRVNVLIATDGVFSMDGVIANLQGVCDLADKYDALVMVDDSHAVGFVGENGRGS